MVATAKEQRCQALKQELKASTHTVHTTNWPQTDVNPDNHKQIGASSLRNTPQIH